METESIESIEFIIQPDGSGALKIYQNGVRPGGDLSVENKNEFKITMMFPEKRCPLSGGSRVGDYICFYVDEKSSATFPVLEKAASGDYPFTLSVPSDLDNREYQVGVHEGGPKCACFTVRENQFRTAVHVDGRKEICIVLNRDKVETGSPDLYYCVSVVCGSASGRDGTSPQGGNFGQGGGSDHGDIIID